MQNKRSNFKTAAGGRTDLREKRYVNRFLFEVVVVEIFIEFWRWF